MTIKFLSLFLFCALLFISACEDQGNPVLVNTPTPTLTSVSPDSGKAGDTITVVGTNFGSSRGTSTVKFGTTNAAAYLMWTATQIKAIVPSGLSSGNTTVAVSVGGKTSGSRTFKSLSTVSFVSFSSAILPLIASYNCASCHPGNGGFSVASHALIVTRVTPGNGDGSLIVQKLRGTAAGSRMPASGPPYMSTTEIQTFVDWINQGALNN